MRFIISSSCPPNALIFILYFLQLVCIHIVGSYLKLEQRPINSTSSSIPAIFVFGDSTVDSGNNNYIQTTSRSNFPPYGRDFPNHIPTGRFTNGRLVTDFVVAHSGGKNFMPPYLDATLTLEDLITGVCFASAGTGFDPLTPELSGGVISMEKQLKYFKEYKARVEQYIGKERTKSLINKAVFIISAGTNDFIVNYYVAPIRRQAYTISTYQQFLLHLGQQFIQGLLELGARKIAFVGLPPMGCVPAVITINSDNAFAHRSCIESLSSVARDYNRMLLNKLTAMRSPGVKITYVDIYKPLDDMIKNPRQFGFDRVNRGCCASGMIEASFLCNPKSFVCSDDTKYVFWDAVHPTEAAYYNLFKSIRPLVDVLLKD